MTFINIWSNHPHHLAPLSACLVSFFSIFMPICFPLFSFSTGFASRLSFDQDEEYEKMQQCYVVECEEYLKIIWARVECLSKKIFVWLGYFRYFIQLKDSHCVLCVYFFYPLGYARFPCRQRHRQRKCQHVNICVCGADFFILLNLIFNIRYTTIMPNEMWVVVGPKVDFSDFHDFSISFTYHVVDTHTTYTANDFCQFSFKLFSRLFDTSSAAHRSQSTWRKLIFSSIKLFRSLPAILLKLRSQLTSNWKIIELLYVSIEFRTFRIQF